LGPLVGYRGTPNPQASLAKKTAAEYYLTYKCRSNNHLPLKDQDLNRAKISVAWFEAMATPQEKRSLFGSDGDKGEKKKLAEKLQRLVKARIASAFGSSVPRDLATDKELTVGAIQSRLSEIESKKLPAIFVDEAAFAVFRADFEAGRPQSAVHAGATKPNPKATASPKPRKTKSAEGGPELEPESEAQQPNAPSKSGEEHEGSKPQSQSIPSPHKKHRA